MEDVHEMKSLKGNPCAAATLWLVILFSTVAGSVRAGSISGSYSNLPVGAAVDLTVAGSADWVHWGLVTETSINRKMPVAPRISDYTLLVGSDGYAQVLSYADNANGYSWSDGSPVLSVTNTTTGVWAYSLPVGEGTGFAISAPADTRPRTLKVYVGVFSGQGEITATLSDNSATPYVESSLSYSGNGASRVYVLNYAANSAGQELRVAWRLKKKQGGATQSPNVTLQAAALDTPGINVPPGVQLTAPSNTAQFLTGQPISIAANSGDVDGSVTNLAFFAGGTKIGEFTNSPYSMNWVGAPPGLYQLTAVVTDNTGESSTSPPVEVVVHGTGGFLSGSVNSPPPSALDLSVEGTLDWTHWGLTSPTSLDRNANVLPVIPSYTQIGTNPVQRLTDSFTTWIWTNGNPTLNNAGSRSGIFVYGRKDGMELMIPASIHPMKLRIYAGLYGAQIGFRAYLSDFSAPAYYGTLSSAFETVDGMFTVQFASASPGQMLVVRLENQALLDPLFGNLRLMSATLQVDDSVVLPVLLTSPMRVGNDFLFSFQTLSNRTYTIEGTDDPANSPWVGLTNFPGTGEVVTFTNALAPPDTHFYRVLSQ